MPSEGAWTLNRSRPRERGHSIVPSLVVSVGSVFACHLVVGPSVELLCWSTPGPGIPIEETLCVSRLENGANTSPRIQEASAKDEK